MDVKILQLNKVTKQFSNAMDKIALSMEPAVQQAGDYIINVAKTLTPVETGTLQASFYQKFEQVGKQVWLEIINPTSYAVFVHEILHYKHKVGEAQFLLKAGISNNNKVLEIISNAIKF